MKSFTLIETIIAITIFTILMGAIFTGVIFVYRTHNYTYQQSTAIEEAHRGIQAMIKEIRGAKPGDDGSYPIEMAGDKEFIFYSDIDGDGSVERIRYFLGGVISGKETQECVVFLKGGSCNVIFSDFYQGNLSSAEVTVSVEGDFGLNNNEYAEISADLYDLGDVCRTGCNDCSGGWEGTAVYDVTNQAIDNMIQFSADSTNSVDPFCDWQNPNHAMKVKFELSWEAEEPDQMHLFKKGVINPTGSPIEYPLDQEEVTIITSYVRNVPPIFRYYYFDEDDKTLKEIEEYPAKLSDTEVMKLLLIVNVNPDRAPDDFELESSVQLRNLNYKE